MTSLDSIKFDELALEKSDYLKQSFKSLQLVVEGLDRSRAKDIALDKIHETFMWVNVAIREDQKSRGASVDKH